MLIQKIAIDANGRIPIPSKMRNMLNIKFGDEIILKYQNNEIVITSYKQSLDNVRSLVRKYTNRSLLQNQEEIKEEDISHE